MSEDNQEHNAMAKYAARDVVYTENMVCRVRLRAALAVLEDLTTVLDEHPDWINSSLEEQRKLEAKLKDLKHRAQRELLRAWRKGE